MWQMLCILHFTIFTICFHFFFVHASNSTVDWTCQSRRSWSWSWSWSRCLESWRSLWKCCTREKHCAVCKLSRSWCWKGNAFVALGGGNLRATLTTPSYRYRYFTTLRYILRPISVLHAPHTHTNKTKEPLHKGDYQHFDLIVLKTKHKIVKQIISKSSLTFEMVKEKDWKWGLAGWQRRFPIGDC